MNLDILALFGAFVWWRQHDVFLSCSGYGGWRGSWRVWWCGMWHGGEAVMWQYCRGVGGATWTWRHWWRGPDVIGQVAGGKRFSPHRCWPRAVLQGGLRSRRKLTHGRGTVAIPPIPRMLTPSRSGTPILLPVVGCGAQDRTVDGHW